MRRQAATAGGRRVIRITVDTNVLPNPELVSLASSLGHDLRVTSVTGRELEGTSVAVRDEAEAESALARALMRRFRGVSTQFSVGGYFGHRIDIALGDGKIGVEVKLVKALLESSGEAYRAIGQAMGPRRPDMQRRPCSPVYVPWIPALSTPQTASRASATIDSATGMPPP